MATLYGTGKGLVRLITGLQILIGLLLFVFGIVAVVLVCHWTSRAGLGIWIGVIVMITAGIGLFSCSVNGQQMISWYSGLSIFCAFLAIVLCISYGTAMADFYDEMKSDTSSVDDFYSRRYVAVYMRTSYYDSCVSAKRKAEIQFERVGVNEVVPAEQDSERKLLSEMEIHGRKALGIATTIMFLAALQFIFSCAAVMYSCTAAGWFLPKHGNTAAKSTITVHHSEASRQLLR